MKSRSLSASILSIALPIMLQSCATTLVGLLDNLMVGRLGSAAISAVAIVNQILSVYTFCVTGIAAGAGVLGAQYYGSGDIRGTRCCFRVRLLLCGGITLLFIPFLLACGGRLIDLFLLGEGEAEQAAETYALALNYLRVRLTGLFLIAAVSCYAGALRETGHAVIPMKAAFAAVLVNAVLNWILIFGPGPFPAFGVIGAAAATVAAETVELAFILLSVHLPKKRNGYPFASGILRSERMPDGIAVLVIRKSFPLTANQLMWSIGGVVLNQQYSLCSLDATTAMNIAGTFWNFFATVFLALGSAAGILVGQTLGGGDTEEAKRMASRCLHLTVVIGTLSGAVFACLSVLIPKIYNIPDDVRTMTTGIILIQSLFMHAVGLTQTGYAVLRAGGKTALPFLIDIVCVWILSVPLAALQVRLGVGLIPLYFVCQAVEWMKNAAVIFLVRKGLWARRIVSEIAE